jgi:hypothetical protein
MQRAMYRTAVGNLHQTLLLLIVERAGKFDFTLDLI